MNDPRKYAFISSLLFVVAMNNGDAFVPYGQREPRDKKKLYEGKRARRKGGLERKTQKYENLIENKNHVIP